MYVYMYIEILYISYINICIIYKSIYKFMYSYFNSELPCSHRLLNAVDPSQNLLGTSSQMWAFLSLFQIYSCRKCRKIVFFCVGLNRNLGC